MPQRDVQRLVPNRNPMHRADWHSLSSSHSLPFGLEPCRHAIATTAGKSWRTGAVAALSTERRFRGGDAYPRFTDFIAVAKFAQRYGATELIAVPIIRPTLLFDLCVQCHARIAVCTLEVRGACLSTVSMTATYTPAVACGAVFCFVARIAGGTRGESSNGI